jgi:FlaA1/EpsC-like NDP-sugar epimerase
LEMGEPVKIMDLAVNLLRLSGYTGDPLERISFIGMRAGEKMHEELVAPEEERISTPVEKIMVLSTVRLRSYNVSRQIPAWIAGIENSRPGAVLSELHRLFPAIPKTVIQDAPLAPLQTYKTS